MKQVTEANDNLSLIDIRKRDFYELKENNQTKNLDNNNNLKEIDFDNKNISLADYVNLSPKLNLEVLKI